MAFVVAAPLAAGAPLAALAVDEVVCFRCENFDLDYEPAHLYVTATGTSNKVLWQQRDFTTIWHGDCRISRAGMLIVKFNCKEEGALVNLKSAVLFLTSASPFIFQGLDYAERHVQMTELWRKTYNWNTRTYQ